jgi:hypothetical protein
MVSPFFPIAVVVTVFWIVYGSYREIVPDVMLRPRNLVDLFFCIWVWASHLWLGVTLMLLLGELL